MPSWARQLLVRMTILSVACVAILGGAWALSGNSGHQGVALDPTPKRESAKQPEATPTEPAKVTPEPKMTTPVAVESGRSSKNAKSQNLIEVDLSKLPPDLAKEVRGAIVEKGEMPPRRDGGEKKRAGNP